MASQKNNSAENGIKASKDTDTKKSGGPDAPKNKPVRQVADPGFMTGMTSRRNLDLAALLLALDNHFNVGQLITTLYRAIMFGTRNASRIVIEIDPFMTNALPDGVNFVEGKPFDLASDPAAAKACERMLMAVTSFLSSGGTLLSDDACKSCFYAIYPQFLTSASHGTKKDENERLAANVARLRELDPLLEAHKADLAGLLDRLDADLNMVGRVKKDEEGHIKLDLNPLTAEQLGRVKTALTPEEFKSLEGLPKLINELIDERNELHKANEKTMGKRMDYIRRAREELDFFTWYDLSTKGKVTFKSDSGYETEDHMLFAYPLLAAALDLDQVCIKFIYHGEFPIDANTPTDALEFFNIWSAARRNTVNKIVTANVATNKEGEKIGTPALPTIKRHTTVLHFWFQASLLSEFIAKIFANRAAIMQNRVMERYQQQPGVEAPVERRVEPNEGAVPKAADDKNETQALAPITESTDEASTKEEASAAAPKEPVQ